MISYPLGKTVGKTDLEWEYMGLSKLIHKLNFVAVKNLCPGLHADGGNLYLRVRESGSRSWVFRFKKSDSTRELGLGSTGSRSLKDARKLSLLMRQLVLEGKDPGEALPKKKEGDAPITFQGLAEEFITTKSVEWKNQKHHQQWRNTLRDYAYPVLGHLHPSQIKLAHILKVLRPIWTTKVETAKRVQGRIEQILDAAYVLEYRTEQNPARYKGVLDKILPNSGKIRKVRHHPSIPYREAAILCRRLREKNTASANCLYFLILTATRSGEARGARWAEIDLEQGMWSIPSERMKPGRAHRVPLSEQVLEFLHKLPAIHGSDLLFPNSKGKALSDVAVSKVLKEIVSDVTVHGMRSTFRGWAAEQTDYPREVCELALAHVNRDRVEAAYQRSDLLEKRRGLMEEWGTYLL